MNLRKTLPSLAGKALAFCGYKCGYGLPCVVGIDKGVLSYRGQGNMLDENAQKSGEEIVADSLDCTSDEKLTGLC